MTSELDRLYVFAPLGGDYALAGRLRWAEGRGRFEYSRDWLAHPDAWPLDPRNLELRDGPFDTTLNGGIHGVFADAGPDAWGRLLIEHERGPSVAANPLEILRLANGSGTGALLFSQSRTRPAPPRTVAAKASLSELEAASTAIAGGRRVSQEALQLVFEHGSSLGGARPKALIADEGEEWIAKFSRPGDPLDIPRLEWACLRLARECGIDVPDQRLAEANGRAVLLVQRFDRSAGKRLHYLSLHALLALERMSPADVVAPTGLVSYFGAASLYRRIGVPDAGRRMFERMLFNVLIGNTDDHARNHGLLLRDGNWDLSPAFDLVAEGKRFHAIGLGPRGREATLENALGALPSYGLDEEMARQSLERMQDALRTAPGLLAESGLEGGDIDLALGRMLEES
ncbi:type II toxin-antitoxin system HipA family toxin [Lysobacter sp. GX 14042]|uniref:type II toxin-antitoxin system HipA family toxin n=1 Tax=Lysobacter sp. GX 14042 TaxID=2907155 RepID=UPI001F330FB1|nr:type II toxin-antitoxin system HipA family toxin [Lysobacter sp. GX 14042]MCE7032802.1 type II toxin-antitoxin system HipA family toxin [Lysobacter sp. GX 14042]